MAKNCVTVEIKGEEKKPPEKPTEPTGVDYVKLGIAVVLGLIGAAGAISVTRKR